MNDFNSNNSTCGNMGSNASIPAGVSMDIAGRLEEIAEQRDEIIHELHKLNRRLEALEEPVPTNTAWQTGYSYPSVRCDQYQIVDTMPIQAAPAHPSVQYGFGAVPACQQQCAPQANANTKILGPLLLVGIAGLLGGLFLADKLDLFESKR